MAFNFNLGTPLKELQARGAHFDVRSGRLVKSAENRGEVRELAEIIIAENPKITSEELLEEVKRRRAPEAKGIFQRIQERFFKRGENFAKSTDAFDKGEQSLAETVLQLGGQGAGFAFDVVGEGLSSVGGAIGAITPQVIKDKVKAGIDESIEQLMANSVTRAGLEAAARGIEAYQEYAEENPSAARNIESVVNIASLLPLGTVGKILGKQAISATREAAKTTSTVAGKAATSLEKALKSQITRDAVAITKPELSGREITAALGTGRGVTKGRGPFKTIEIAPNSSDIRVAQSVEDVVKNANGPVENIQAVLTKIGRISTDVDKNLAGHNDLKTIFNQPKLKSALDVTKEKSKVLFGSDKVLEGNYDTIIEEMLRISTRHPKTLKGLREARTEFDAVMREKFPNVFKTIGGDNVKSNAILDVRRAVNDFIEDRLPEGNPFKAQMKQISDMYTAKDNIANKARSLVDAGSTERLLRFLRANPLVAGATGGILTFGAIRGLLLNPVVIGGLILGGTINIGGKVITAQIVKRALISMLRAIEAGPNAKAAAVIKDLKELINNLD